MLVANGFMDYLERSVIEDFPILNSIRYWGRFVDDILFIWCDSDASVNDLLAFLSNHSFSLFHSGITWSSNCSLGPRYHVKTRPWLQVCFLGNLQETDLQRCLDP